MYRAIPDSNENKVNRRRDTTESVSKLLIARWNARLYSVLLASGVLLASCGSTRSTISREELVDLRDDTGCEGVGVSNEDHTTLVMKIISGTFDQSDESTIYALYPYLSPDTLQQYFRRDNELLHGIKLIRAQSGNHSIRLIAHPSVNNRAVAEGPIPTTFDVRARYDIKTNTSHITDFENFGPGLIAHLNYYDPSISHESYAVAQLVRKIIAEATHAQQRDSLGAVTLYDQFKLEDSLYASIHCNPYTVPTTVEGEAHLLREPKIARGFVTKYAESIQKSHELHQWELLQLITEHYFTMESTQSPRSDGIIATCKQKRRELGDDDVR